MAPNATAINREEHMGRFSVELEVVNHQDVVAAQLGVIPPDKVRRARLPGVVDTGASRLVRTQARGEFQATSI